MPPTQDSSDGASTGQDGHRNVRRRTFLTTTGLAATTAIAGCAGGGQDDEGENQADTTTETTQSDSDDSDSDTTTESKPYAGDTLKVSIWSGKTVEDWRNKIVPPFEEQTGATVELIPGWSEITSKIQSAPEDDPPYDVTVGDGYVHSNGVAADLFLKIRYENIPNFEDVYQYLKDFRPHEFGVPVAGMPMSILYREDSDFKPTSWSDFASDAGASAKLGMEGSWYAYPAHIAAITMDDLPKAGEMYDEQYHEPVFDELASWDINKWYGGGGEFWEALRNGVVDAAQYYMNTHREAQQEDNIGFAFPQDGSVWYWDHYHVVRGTDHRDLGEEFINYLLDPETQTLYADNAYVAPGNQKAELKKDILKDNYPQSNEEWEEDAVFFDVPYLQQRWSKFSEMFKKVKQQS